MSVDDETAGMPSASPLRTGDGRTMIGHAIIERGHDRDGIDSLAIWHVSTDGLRTGAWVVPSEKAFGDAATAERMLGILLRHAILTCGGDSLTHVEGIETTAGAQPRPWRQDVVVLPEILAHIAITRTRLEAAVELRRKDNKRILPVAWKANIPQPVPATAAELRSLTQVHVPAVKSPVTHTALELAILTGWAIAQWQETLNVAARRSYLRDVLGPATALPPVWEARLANAFAR